jgi:DNA processing protein
MSDFSDVRDALLVLNALPNIGPITLNRLLVDLGGDARSIFSASTAQLEKVKGVGPAISATVKNWRQFFDLEREKERMQQSGADFITPSDPEYPKLLKEIHDPPIGLYRKGDYNFDAPCIAIVGSRRTTLYGQSVARKFASELARLNFCIVSGLARGIDTAAHEGALEVGGKTAAVVGCGIDIVYPPENLELYRKIEEAGAVISEFPFGRRADRQSFPMRNRVVAGICDATVVVETDVNGGSMITARFAGEHGRLVFAVPGRIDQATSQGCHQLIRDGAILLTCVDELLEELSYLNGLRPQPLEKPAYTAGENIGELTEDETAILECFDGGAILSIDEIATQTTIPAGQVASSLMMLELKCIVTKRADGRFEARSG